MKITRFNPMTPEFVSASRLFDVPVRFGRLFDDLLTTSEGLGWMPPMDVIEKDGMLELSAELPGIKKDDVEILVSDGVLTIKGEKKSEKEEKNAEYRLWERSYGTFERSFTLPRSVDTAAVKAEFENGVLRVTLPRTVQSQGKRVEIAGG